MNSWIKRADLLADWCFEKLANRFDAYGLYHSDGTAETKKGELTAEVLAAHFRGEITVGLHAISDTDTSKWLCFDTDCHNRGSDWQAAELWCQEVDAMLQKCEFCPLLFKSGRGFHLYVIFDKPVPSANVHNYGRNIVVDFPVPTGASVEVFPKAGSANGKFGGGWLRLPGKHPTLDHYHQAWDGAEFWFDDAKDTTSAILATVGDPAGDFLDAKYATPSAANVAADGDTPVALEPGEKLRPSMQTQGFLEFGAEPGSRHNLSYAAACDLLGCGWTADEILERFIPLIVADDHPESEVRKTVRDAAKAKPGPSNPEARLVMTKENTSAELEAAAVAAPLEPWVAFPTTTLPEPLRRFVCEGAESLHVDESFLALPTLAVCASAIGTARRVRLKKTWCEPSVLWCALLGPSGVRKSPPVKLATEPVHSVQNSDFAVYESEKLSHENKLIEYECFLKLWKKARVGDMPTKPEPPVLRRLLGSDTTIEALARILQSSPRGILICRDELSAWLGSFDCYKTGNADVGAWLSLYGALPLTVDRASREPIHVKCASASVVGGVQPKILARMLGEEHFENGLAARLLLACPPIEPAMWTDSELAPSVRQAYAETIQRLLALESDGSSDDPVPRDVTLSPDARALFVSFHDEQAELIAELGDSHLAAAFLKLQGGAARLALVLRLVTDPDASTVDAESMQAGISLARWFGHEATRCYGLLAESVEQGEDRKLLDFIESRGGRATVREVVRGCRWTATTANAKAILQRLADAELGAWDTPPPGKKGGPPRKSFLLKTTDDA